MTTAGSILHIFSIGVMDGVLGTTGGGGKKSI